MPRLAAALALLAVLLVPAPVLGQDSYPSEVRPHSTLTVRDRGEVAIRGLVASTRRSGDRLRVRVSLWAEPRGRAARTVVVRIGRCIGGPASSLRCPPTVNRTLRLRAGDRSPKLATATVLMPARRHDAFRVVVTRPGERSRFGENVYGELELRGDAWRRSPRGIPFGLYALSAPADFDLRGVRVDVVGISPDAARPSVAFEAVSAIERTVRATPRLCADTAGCPGPARDVRLAPGVPGGDFRRPFLRGQNGAVTYTGDDAATGARLFLVTLPFPQR